MHRNVVSIVTDVDGEAATGQERRGQEKATEKGEVMDEILTFISVRNIDFFRIRCQNN